MFKQENMSRENQKCLERVKIFFDKYSRSLTPDLKILYVEADGNSLTMDVTFKTHWKERSELILSHADARIQEMESIISEELFIDLLMWNMNVTYKWIERLSMEILTGVDRCKMLATVIGTGEGISDPANLAIQFDGLARSKSVLDPSWYDNQMQYLAGMTIESFCK